MNEIPFLYSTSPETNYAPAASNPIPPQSSRCAGIEKETDYRESNSRKDGANREKEGSEDYRIERENIDEIVNSEADTAF
jgi:hypothetical protein